MFLQAGVSWFLRRATRSLGVAALALAFLVAARAHGRPGARRAARSRHRRTTGRAIAGARIEIVRSCRAGAFGCGRSVRRARPRAGDVRRRHSRRRLRGVHDATFPSRTAAPRSWTQRSSRCRTPLAAVVSSARRPASERETAAFDRAAIESLGTPRRRRASADGSGRRGHAQRRPGITDAGLDSRIERGRSARGRRRRPVATRRSRASPTCRNCRSRRSSA